jgi:predicted TIM-barrel fold metal-dependent hydrolase
MRRRTLLFALAGLAAASARAADSTAIPDIAGPVAKPRRPKFRLPAGSVDTHAHVFGPVGDYPYASNRPYTPPDAPLAMFRNLHRAIGVDRAVIVNASIYGSDNRVITDAIAQSGGRYKGVGNCVNTMTDEELRALDRAGICACRFNFVKRLGGVGDMKAFRELVDRVEALGWHVDIYLERGTVREFVPILKSLPVPYVLDHMGTISVAGGIDDPEFKALLDLQASDGRCWIKITGLERATVAGPPFADAVPFARRLVENAPDRVLWGTDWPHPNAPHIPDDGALVNLIPQFAPDRNLQRQLLVTNPERLYRFGAR